MRLNKTLQDCIQFAHFCREYSFAPIDVAELITLTHQRANAEAKALSYDVEGYSVRANHILRKVEQQATDMGLGISWPGLYPSLIGADGREVRLPIV